MKFLTIEGNIGSGKSTLMNRLIPWLNNRNYRVVVVNEPLDDWINCIDKYGYNHFESYYSSPQTEAFTFQMMCMVSRITALKEAIEEYENEDNVVVVCERSIDSGNFIFGEHLVRTNCMSKSEQDYILHKAVFLKPIVDDHIVVMIQTTVDTCISRINNRRRSGEASISADYLSGLEKLIVEFPRSYTLDGEYSQDCIFKDALIYLEKHYPRCHEYETSD